jgi:hypothetical protein
VLPPVCVKKGSVTLGAAKFYVGGCCYDNPNLLGGHTCFVICDPGENAFFRGKAATRQPTLINSLKTKNGTGSLYSFVELCVQQVGNPTALVAAKQAIHTFAMRATKGVGCHVSMHTPQQGTWNLLPIIALAREAAAAAGKTDKYGVLHAMDWLTAAGADLVHSLFMPERDASVARWAEVTTTLTVQRTSIKLVVHYYDGVQGAPDDSVTESGHTLAFGQVQAGPPARSTAAHEDLLSGGCDPQVLASSGGDIPQAIVEPPSARLQK